MSSMTDSQSSQVPVVRVVWAVNRRHAIQHNFARLAGHSVGPVVFNHQLGILTIPDDLPDFYHYPYLYPCPYP